MARVVSICPSCKKSGHISKKVIVNANHELRYLKYCICCGKKLPSRHAARINEHLSKNLRIS